MQLQRIAKRTLSDEVFEQLSREIVQGRMAPGAALPAERELCETLGVNRGALREALRRLSQRQVQSRVSGSGFVVRQEPAPGTPLPVAGGCRLWCEVPESVARNRTGVNAASASMNRP